MGHGGNEKRQGKTKILAENCAGNTFFTNHLIYDSSYILVTTHQVWIPHYFNQLSCFMDNEL